MLTRHLRSAVRRLLRDRLASAINVVGLAIAIAACVAVYLFLQVYYTLDTGHARADRIVMAERVEARADGPQTWGRTPRALGPALTADLPQVEGAVRTAWATGDVRTPSASFEESVRLADASLFDVFTFPLQAGTATLADPGSAVLSADAAHKYFGDAPAVGKRLTVALDGGEARAFTVAAVAAPFPNNASLRFDVLLPLADSSAGWAASDVATFLLLRRPADLAAVEAQTGRYVSRMNQADPEARVERLAFERLTDPGPGAARVRQRPTEAPDPVLTGLLVGLAVLMLFLACVNSVNVALGSASRRVKEVGVRKAIGGSRGDIAAQFMAENALVCALALGLGVLLAQTALVPLFNSLFVIDVSLVGNFRLWAFLVALLAAVAVASGAYPALYVSGLQPSRILQGAARLPPKSRLTRGLATAQFCVAFVAVIATVVLALNGRFLERQAWGYSPDGLVVVKLTEPSAFGAMRDAAAQQAGVVRVAGSPDHVGAGVGRTRFTVGDDTTQHEAVVLAIGPGYAEALGLRLERGRFADDRLASDTLTAVVNARFARERGVDVGQTLRIDRQDVTVVGVVGDFLYDPVVKAQATILRTSAAAPRWLAVRVDPGREAAVRAALAAAWARRVPDAPFEAFTQREVFEDQLGAYANLSRALAALAGLALLIACMGVFGLASQNVSRRMKEVSVRKVLGASVGQLVVLVNRPFLAILAVAGVIGTIAGLAGLRLVAGLDAVNLMPLTPVPFLVAYALVLIPVAVSVASQSRVLVLSNPADVLRGD